jgi:hypothetical protein
VKGGCGVSRFSGLPSQTAAPASNRCCGLWVAGRLAAKTLHTRTAPGVDATNRWMTAPLMTCHRHTTLRRAGRGGRNAWAVIAGDEGRLGGRGGA